MSKEITPSGFIIDFDNTLVKTNSFVKAHILKTCIRLNVNPPENTEIENVLRENLPFELIFERLFGAQGGEILATYREDAMNTHYKPTDGGIEFVRDVLARNINIVIVSNRIRKLEKRLTQAGYNPDWISAIITPDFPKPDKNAYHTALEILDNNGAERERIYIIGDSTDDFLSCPNDLKGNFFAVLSGPNTAKHFEKVGLNKKQMVKSPKELLERMT